MIFRQIGAFAQPLEEGAKYLGKGYNTWSKEDALMAGARIGPSTSFRAARVEQGDPLPPPTPIVQLTKAPSGPAATEEGVPRAVLIGGGVVGVLAIAAIAYKLTR
jgi:hypothetical protein